MPLELAGDALRRDQQRAGAVLDRMPTASRPDLEVDVGEADADDLRLGRRGRLLERELADVQRLAERRRCPRSARDAQRAAGDTGSAVERLAVVVVLISSVIDPTAEREVGGEARRQLRSYAVMLAAMPSLSTRIWPVVIVTVTNVSAAVAERERDVVEVDRDQVRDLREREVAAQPLAEGLEEDVRALDRDQPAASVHAVARSGCVAAVVFSRTSNVPPTVMPGMLTATVAEIRPKTPACSRASRTPLPFDTVTKSRWSVPIRSATFASVIRVRVSSSPLPNVLSAPSCVDRSTVKSPRDALADDRDREAGERDADVAAGRRATASR